MKLRNKLIAVITPAAVIATTAPITLVSCGDKNSVSYTGDKNITLTSAQPTKDLTFTLSKALKSTETIKVSTPKVIGDAPSYVLKSISGTTIVLTIGLSSTPPSESTFDLLFKCTDNSTQKTWESKVTGFTVKRNA